MKKLLLLSLTVILSSTLLAQRLLPIIDSGDVLPFKPMHGEVASLCEWNNKLVVAGDIETMNGDSVRDVFIWDGDHAEVLVSSWPGKRIMAIASFNARPMAATSTGSSPGK